MPAAELTDDFGSQQSVSEDTNMRKGNRHRLHHYIVREIGLRILTEKIPAGRTLPTDSELCDELHVSRTALREALIVLAAKGLIEARQKIGTVVRPKEEWNMLDSDLLNWRIDSFDGDQALMELYELRKLIEPLAASLAAEKSTEVDKKKLQAAYQDMALAGDDGSRVLEPDMRFHRGVIAATGNSLFASMGLTIGAALEVNFQVVKDTPRGHAWSLPLHKAVMDAILVGNPTRARLAMQRLLQASEEDLFSFRNVTSAIEKRRDISKLHKKLRERGEK